MTSSSKAEGRFGKKDFVYIAADDEYQCPAGQRAIKRFSTVEDGLELDAYWSSACPSCSIRGEGALHTQLNRHCPLLLRDYLLAVFKSVLTPLQP